MEVSLFVLELLVSIYDYVMLLFNLLSCGQLSLSVLIVHDNSGTLLLPTETTVFGLLGSLHPLFAMFYSLFCSQLILHL